MTTAATKVPAWLQRGALAYMIICLCALLFLYQVLEERGAADWSFFPIIVGSAGVFFRWGPAPLLLIGSVALVVMLESNRFLFHSSATIRVPDLLVSATVLAYAMAHYRLTRIHTPFPAGGVKTGGQRKGTKVDTRLHSMLDDADVLADLVLREQPDSPFISPRELGLLLLALPIWTGLAQVLWLVLPQTAGNPGLIVPVWRVILWLWIFGGIALLATSGFAYWHRSTMSVEEATLFLQDTLWRETRGEQRRINRWFAWARVRARQPSFWQDVTTNWRLLLLVLFVDLMIVLLILGRPS